MLELVLFDADGVLFESTESNIAYYNHVFGLVGEPPLDAEEERLGVFLSAEQVFAHRAAGDAALNRRLHQVAAGLDSTRFFHMLRPPFELRPFLMQFKPRHKLGLATNRSATVPALIAHLNLSGVFDVVASVRDRVRPKPAPDILNLCLERAGIGPAQAIYIGDSQIDHEAAAAAGVRFIGVGPRVKTPHAIDRLHELSAALARLRVS